MMIIDENVLKHLENLANLKLEEEERKKLIKDLNKILDYVGNIKNMELGEVEGVYTPIETNVKLRKDKVLPSVSDRAIIEENFPEKSENGVRVPSIK